MLRVLSIVFAACVTLSGAPAQAIEKARAPQSHDGALDKSDLQRRRAAMAGIKSWAIQLRFLDRAALASANVDLVVIDHAPHPKKEIEIPFTAGDIAPLKMQPDGRRRIVLAYLSIGEAERYRYYWKPEWDAAQSRPVWLGAENPNWPGDYAVQFSNPDWQSIIFGRRDSFLDRIIAAGFDGAYLDRVDAFQDFEETTPGIEDAMIGFIQRLADHAHRVNPNFLIVMQNAEELTKSKSLLARIDGLAKEDLLYGLDNGTAANPPEMVRETLSNLRRAMKSGVKVLMLEYARTPEAINASRQLAQREGFVLHITDRMLGVLSPQAPATSAPAAVPRR